MVSGDLRNLVASAPGIEIIHWWWTKVVLHGGRRKCGKLIIIRHMVARMLKLQLLVRVERLWLTSHAVWAGSLSLIEVVVRIRLVVILWVSVNRVAHHGDL